MKHVDHVKLVVPVLDLGHLQGTADDISKIDFHADHVDVELTIPEHFPSVISAQDQAVLDQVIARSQQILDKLRGVNTQPPPQ